MRKLCMTTSKKIHLCNSWQENSSNLGSITSKLCTYIRNCYIFIVWTLDEMLSKRVYMQYERRYFSLLRFLGLFGMSPAQHEIVIFSICKYDRQRNCLMRFCATGDRVYSQSPGNKNSHFSDDFDAKPSPGLKQ